MREFLNIVESSVRTDLPPKLYHGTDLFAACMILESNKLANGIDSGPKGVSLTTGFKMAWSFADRSTFIWTENHLVHYPEVEKKLGEAPMHGCVFELDSARLLKHFRIEHHAWDDVDDEEEERVLTPDGISSLNTYLTAIYLHPTDVEWFARLIEEIGPGHDITYGMSADEMRSILKHPLVKAV